MLTSGRTCTPTPSCPEAPPCTPVLLTECRRRSPLLPHPPSRSRSSLLQRGSTPSGSEDPSWPPSPPSSRCGSASRSMTSPAQPSCTGSASNGDNFHSRHEEIDLRLKLSLYACKYAWFMLAFLRIKLNQIKS